LEGEGRERRGLGLEEEDRTMAPLFAIYSNIHDEFIKLIFAVKYLFAVVPPTSGWYQVPLEG